MVTNMVLIAIVGIVDVLLGWLPDSPFRVPAEAVAGIFDGQIIGWINFFLPLTEIITIMTVWVAAVAGYYAVSILLRLLKVI
jgi:hypothetical protein